MPPRNETIIMFNWLTKKKLVQQSADTIVIKASMLDSTSPAADDDYWMYADNSHADIIADAGTRARCRARCRYVWLNDPNARNMVRAFGVTVIGEGARVQLQTELKEEQQSVENQFQKWAEDVCLSEKLDLMVKSLMFDGESFLRLVNDAHIDCGLNVAIIDAARVSNGFDSFNDKDNVDGIVYDEYEHPVRYYVYRHNPNPNYNTTWTPDIIDAKQIYHFFIADLPEQHRGLPLMQSVIKDFGALRRYNAAVVEGAEVAAANSFVVKSEQLPAGTKAGEVDPFTTVLSPRRGGMFLPRGWDAVQMKAEQPTQNHGTFNTTMLSQIGGGIGEPRNIATNDSSSYNYSSARLDHLIFNRYVRTVQKKIQKLYNWIFDAWMLCNKDNWSVNALLSTIDTSMSEISRQWLFAKPESIDPLKDANTDIALINAGLLTRGEVYAREGQDPETQLQRWQDEIKKFGMPSTSVDETDKTKPGREVVSQTVIDDKEVTTLPPTDGEQLANTALNGAQVASAVDIVIKVASGELPQESAVVMLVKFFQLSEADAKAMIEPVEQKVL